MTRAFLSNMTLDARTTYTLEFKSSRKVYIAVYIRVKFVLTRKTFTIKAKKLNEEAGKF